MICYLKSLNPLNVTNSLINNEVISTYTSKNGVIFLIKTIRKKLDLLLLGLIILVFCICVIKLQNLKAPWVDECYTYYGVWHDNFSEFYDSMLTGINFSPPLYFFLNFIFQWFFPTSIEVLRIQSLLWVLIGITISFFLTRKLFDSLPALLATILVVAQSNLLLSQSLEARHYSMFFACGAWVLYMLKIDSRQPNNLRSKLLIYTSHLCLIQIHYLGIIFSGLVGIAYLISFKNSLLKRIPIEICLAWITAIPVLLFFIGKQESVLNYWPKPNGLIDLLNTYNESFICFSILIPAIIVLCTGKYSTKKRIAYKEANTRNNLVIITAILWLKTPAIFWAFSHTSNINLFVDRYFMPKEIAIVVLVASAINFLIRKIKIQSSGLLYLLTSFICIIFVCLNFKRFAHTLNSEHNYHHKLIINEENKFNAKENIILHSDPSFFPNTYLKGNQYHFKIPEKKRRELYRKFSNKIKLVE